MSAPSDAVRARVGPELLAQLEHALSPSELASLLMSVAATRAAAVSPAQLLRDDAYTRPSATDPRRLAAVEHLVWQALPAEFEGLELSPVAPLGAVSALTGLSQDRVLTTSRGTEVVADATNVLAVEAARRRRAGSPVVHLAAAHRLLRMQRFTAAGASQHFKLLSLVSSARDTGSGRTEAALVVLHLRGLLAVAKAAGARDLEVRWAVYDEGAVAERVRDTVVPAVGLPFAELPDDSGRGYYRSVRFKVFAGDVELGDGGPTGWTAALLSDAKERCVTSCVSTERLTRLAPDG